MGNSAFQALSKSRAKPRTEPSEDGVAFHRRLSVQQFLKHHGPLLSALAAAGVDPETQPLDALTQMAERSRAMAFRLAAVVSGKAIGEVREQDARFFRREAAIVVADAWRHDRLENLDRTEEMMRRALLAVAEHAPGFYLDDVDWKNIDDEASAVMGRLSTTARLASTLAETYTFRLSMDEAVERACSPVFEVTNATLESDGYARFEGHARHSLRATLLRTNAEMMAATWRRHARSFLEDILSWPVSQRGAEIDRRNPVATIDAEFRLRAEAVARMALAEGQVKAESLTPGMPTR